MSSQGRARAPQEQNIRESKFKNSLRKGEKLSGKQTERGMREAWLIPRGPTENALWSSVLRVDNNAAIKRRTNIRRKRIADSQRVFLCAVQDFLWLWSIALRWNAVWSLAVLAKNFKAAAAGHAAHHHLPTLTVGIKWDRFSGSMGLQLSLTPLWWGIQRGNKYLIDVDAVFEGLKEDSSARTPKQSYSKKE